MNWGNNLIINFDYFELSFLYLFWLWAAAVQRTLYFKKNRIQEQSHVLVFSEIDNFGPISSHISGLELITSSWKIKLENSRRSFKSEITFRNQRFIFMTMIKGDLKLQKNPKTVLRRYYIKETCSDDDLKLWADHILWSIRPLKVDCS